MAATWKHPMLGTFTFDTMGWTKIVSVPAFKAFSYDTGYDNAPRSTGKHALVFIAPWGENTEPSAADVALADRVLANQAALVDVVAHALWEDFNDRWPNSGMWWHGNLNAVAKSWKALKLPPPAEARDLLPALQVMRIIVRGGFPTFPVDPIVELCFHAAFEEEHGVGLLTDGESILGAGYYLDVMPYDYTYKSPVPPRFFG